MILLFERSALLGQTRLVVTSFKVKFDGNL